MLNNANNACPCGVCQMLGEARPAQQPQPKPQQPQPRPQQVAQQIHPSLNQAALIKLHSQPTPQAFSRHLNPLRAVEAAQAAGLLP